MIKKSKILCQSESGISYDIEYEASMNCPHCGSKNFTKAVTNYSPIESNSSQNQIKTNYLVFECPNCNKVYMAYGKLSSSPILKNLFNFKLEYITPNPKLERESSKEIKDVSPDFIEIYNKALAIENLGDKESAAMVYRKSLEFLVKDYLIYAKLAQSEDFEKKSIMDIIIKYFNKDDKLKYPATIAFWIGNDYTHYELKNNFSSIQTLKEYIETVVYYIQFEVRSATSKDIYASVKNTTTP